MKDEPNITNTAVLAGAHARAEVRTADVRHGAAMVFAASEMEFS